MWRDHFLYIAISTNETNVCLIGFIVLHPLISRHNIKCYVVHHIRGSHPPNPGASCQRVEHQESWWVGALNALNPGGSVRLLLEKVLFCFIDSMQEIWEGLVIMLNVYMS